MTDADTPVVVVGAGLAGVACARALRDAGVAAVVRERSRVVGGRLATRRYDGRPADIGAAYFTVPATDTDGFAEVVDGWAVTGLARPWTTTMAVYDQQTGWSSAAGPLRWAAPGGLRSLVADLATGLDVRTGDPVHDIGPGPTVDGVRVPAVVLAMPDPQAARLLRPELTSATRAVSGREWEPVLALTARYRSRAWRALPAAFVNGHPVLATIADDGDRRGDHAPVLVAHSTADFARPHLADPAAAGPALLAAVEELLGPLGDPVMSHVHRWSFARPSRARDEPFHLDEHGIGLAGDGWGPSRVHTAWRSGTLLGGALAEGLRR